MGKGGTIQRIDLVSRMINFYIHVFCFFHIFFFFFFFFVFFTLFCFFSPQVVLSACSTYFDTILSQHEEKHPIVIMRDVKFSDMRVLVDFMYKGEINIDHVSLIFFLPHPPPFISTPLNFFVSLLLFFAGDSLFIFFAPRLLRSAVCLCVFFSR